jgi:enamine deaminase RidA (YjgF/YER057c/UK114 family)
MAVTPVFHMLAGAPAPVAPYSHAVEADGWVFLTGQIPNDPDDPAAPLPRGIEAQTRRTLDNLVRVLAGLGLGLPHVVAGRVFLTHFEEDYQRMNRVYESYFRDASAPEARPTPSGNPAPGADRAAGRLPARTCVGVTALALGARIEIDFVARRP